MCVCPFIRECRLASHELHRFFFNESENILRSLCVIYYKRPGIILTINLFHNFNIQLQNGVKKQNLQNSFHCQDYTMGSYQGSTRVQLMLGYKHISLGTTAFKASVKLSKVEVYIKWRHY